MHLLQLTIPLLLLDLVTKWLVCPLQRQICSRLLDELRSGFLENLDHLLQTPRLCPYFTDSKVYCLVEML